MNKMERRYSFHIGNREKRAISNIRKLNINVSEYLRFSLVNLQNHLKQKYKNDNDEKLVIKIRNDKDFEKYSFLIEDMKNERA
jgi:hypothetical protein